MESSQPRPHGAALLLVFVMLFGSMLPHNAQAQDSGRVITVGFSGQGRPITASVFGNGPQKLVVVGDTHGGPEANTYQLASQLVSYFEANPGDVPASVRLYIIPTLNPDGLEIGTRFNARGVDLNRNMNTNFDTCTDNDWSAVVQGAYGYVSETGGPYPDSEVESRVIRNFLLDAQGAIFIHSNAGLVFPAACEHAPSIAMAQIYAESANYVYARYWPNYNITGGMGDWAGSMGIAAITPELVTGELPEYEQNLAGLKAVLASADTLLLPPQERSEYGVPMSEPIWRFWKAYGSEDVFGVPLGPASTQGGLTRQEFTNGALELHPELADTSGLVQPASTPRDRLVAPIAPATDDASGRYFSETAHNLAEPFWTAWQRRDGTRVYGLPISEQRTITTTDGQQRTAQFFEHAVLVYYPEDDTVRAEPLGWQETVVAELAAPTQPFQLR